ncbi:MAG: exonuclease domain-containing protein, partial [Candidatus Neomarinimicrobiota bacterium]|nr:exonuclease domain-containing protein [Candidatus Neomarinimicrobiota bacterium]
MDRKELLKLVNLSHFIAFDFETTGLDPVSDRIIEIAALRFVDGEITNRFVTLVNPDQPIPPMITRITGISNEMVRKKPQEGEIIDELLSFLGEDPLVAHNIRFDQSFLKSLCERFDKDEVSNPLYDTLQLGRSLLFDQAVFNLSSLSEFFGLSAKGAHRAEKDTENCGLIFLYLVEELAGYPLELLTKILTMVKHAEIPNKNLYVDLANQLIQKGDISSGLTRVKHDHGLKTNTFRWDGSNDATEIRAEDVFGPNGLLKEVHPNFESRHNQMKYALNADQILSGSRCIGVAEAGTGLGKTMAYLFGAFKRSSHLEQVGPTVVSCHTKHLQDQLFYKDLPQLAKTMDIPIKAVMMKGRNNYICKTRFDWMIADTSTMDNEDVETLLPIIFWLYWTKTGDISECSGFFNARRSWLKSSFCSEPGFCTGEICNRHRGCYYGQLRQSLYSAHTIVVNHSLLLMEADKPGFLPEFNAVIIDEAHNLVKSAYDQFKIEWSEKGTSLLLQNVDPAHPRSMNWNNLLQQINDIRPGVVKLRDELQGSVKKVQDSLKDFMQALNDDNETRFNPKKQYQEKPILGSINKIFAPVTTELTALKLGLGSIITLLEKIRKTILEMDPTRTDYPLLHPV